MNRHGDGPTTTGLAIHHGGVLSPFNAWLVMRGMNTLNLRMIAHQDNAMRLARHLESHEAVRRVIYPGLQSRPQHALALKQMANFSGMISFQVDDVESISRRMMTSLRVIHYAVSLGHHRSLIYRLDTAELNESTLHLEGEALARYREFAGHGIFRLSVGLEDAADLETDLGNVLCG